MKLVNGLIFIELGNNIILVGLKSEDYSIPELFLFDLYTIEKNITIDGITLYGDVIALKKIGNKYFGLSIDEIDKVISILNNKSSS